MLGAIALRPARASVSPAHTPWERQADTEAAAWAVDALLRLDEQIEDLREHLGLDAYPAVADLEDDRLVRSLDAQLDHDGLELRLCHEVGRVEHRGEWIA